MGLTGANGSGKSSLFAVIAGRLEADQGNVILPRDTLITEVLQETHDSDRTAIDYVIDGDQPFRSLELNIAQAELDDNGTLLATLHSQMDDIDGFRVSARAGQLLHGLGFSAKEQSQSVNTFSGGWRMRLNLACALMTRADLLLLDEPTNHLDLDAMVWLERWLTGYLGIVLVISHDREFLDRSVTRIAHIEGGTIQVYEGNYSLAEERRAAWIAIQNKQHLRQQKQVRHMRSYIDRFRYKASKAKQAQSRIKALQRLEIISPVHQENAFVFEFETPDHSPHQLIDLRELDAGYDEAVLSNVNFRLSDGDRIGLLGRNGAGKTTLLATIAGLLKPSAGRVTLDKKDVTGWAPDRMLRAGLALVPEHRRIFSDFTVRENLLVGGVTQPVGRRQELLDEMVTLFPVLKERLSAQAGYLSGGEAQQLAIGRALMSDPAVLLMDEPSLGLAPVLVDQVFDLITRLRESGRTLFVVEQNAQRMLAVADRAYVMRSGEIVADGPAAQLAAREDLFETYLGQSGGSA